MNWARGKEGVEGGCLVMDVEPRLAEGKISSPEAFRASVLGRGDSRSRVESRRTQGNRR